MDNTIQKILCVNQIKLPSELLNIVKSYAFNEINKEKKKHLLLYSSVIDKITNSSIRIKKRKHINYQFRNGTFWFFMSSGKEIILYSCFCNKCGNYLIAESGMNISISCFCNL